MELNVSTEQLAGDQLPDAPSDVKGQDGKWHSIIPMELMLEAIDCAADCIMSRDAERALYVLAELKLRLLADAALYERIFSEQMYGHAAVRQ